MMTLSTISVTPKSRVLQNGTANDATSPEASFVELYNNDQTLATALNSTIQAVNGYTPYTGLKNLIFGGDFSTNPWQRGTSFSSIAGGSYTADRFVWNQSGSGAVNISKSTDVPSVSQAGRLVQSSLAISVATADAALINHIYFLEQRVEGYHFASIAQKSFTLSFWVNSSVSGIHSVAFRNAGSDECYVAEYTILVANTWQYVSLTIPASPITGTWNYTNGVGLDICWPLGASVNTGTAGSWQASNIASSVNQVNIMVTVGNTFKLALIQLEGGSLATTFENRSIQQETLLCQRYYYVTVNGLSTYSTVSNQNWCYPVYFPAAMRTAPSVSYNFASGTNYAGISTLQDSNTSLVVQQQFGTGNGYCLQTIFCNAEL